MKTAIDVYRIYWPEDAEKHILEHLTHTECSSVHDMFSHMMNSHNFRRRTAELSGKAIHLYRPEDIQYLESWIKKSRYVADEYREVLLDVIDMMHHDIDVWISFV